jgi:hypothetical protein
VRNTPTSRSASTAARGKNGACSQPSEVLQQSAWV